MNKKKSIKTNAYLLVVIIILSSCITNVDEEIVIDDLTVEDPCSTITYALNVRPILNDNCTSCHSTNGGQSPNLETFQGVKDNAFLVRAEVVSREMPIGGSLTNQEIQAISCWVDAGALNN